jgi:hypothetical protein
MTDRMTRGAKLLAAVLLANALIVLALAVFAWR